MLIYLYYVFEVLKNLNVALQDDEKLYLKPIGKNKEFVMKLEFLRYKYALFISNIACDYCVNFQIRTILFNPAIFNQFLKSIYYNESLVFKIHYIEDVDRYMLIKAPFKKTPIYLTTEKKVP